MPYNVLVVSLIIPTEGLEPAIAGEDIPNNVLVVSLIIPTEGLERYKRAWHLDGPPAL